MAKVKYSKETSDSVIGADVLRKNADAQVLMSEEKRKIKKMKSGVADVITKKLKSGLIIKYNRKTNRFSYGLKRVLDGKVVTISEHAATSHLKYWTDHWKTTPELTKSLIKATDKLVGNFKLTTKYKKKVETPAQAELTKMEFAMNSDEAIRYKDTNLFLCWSNIKTLNYMFGEIRGYSFHINREQALWVIGWEMLHKGSKEESELQKIEARLHIGGTTLLRYKDTDLYLEMDEPDGVFLYRKGTGSQFDVNITRDEALSIIRQKLEIKEQIKSIHETYSPEEEVLKNIENKLEAEPFECAMGKHHRYNNKLHIIYYPTISKFSYFDINGEINREKSLTIIYDDINKQSKVEEKPVQPESDLVFVCLFGEKIRIFEAISKEYSSAILKVDKEGATSLYLSQEDNTKVTDLHRHLFNVIDQSFHDSY